MSLIQRQAMMADYLGQRYGVDPSEIRWFCGQLRAVESETGMVVEGFSNVETEDRHGTVFDPDGADQRAWSRNPVGFYNHDPDEPIVLWDPDASTIKANDDGLRGLWDRGVLMNDTPVQQKATHLARQRLLRAISIGFIPRDGEERDGTWTFTEYEILEKSLVTIPSNRESLFSIQEAADRGSDLACPRCNGQPAQLVALPNAEAAVRSLEAHIESLDDTTEIADMVPRLRDVIDTITRRRSATEEEIAAAVVVAANLMRETR